MDEVVIGLVERLRVPAFALVPHLPAALQQCVALASADARQQVLHRVRSLDGGIHLEHKVTAREEVPSLDLGLVACLLQALGDPFGPTLVSVGIADEVVFGCIGVHDSLLLRLAVEHSFDVVVAV